MDIRRVKAQTASAYLENYRNTAKHLVKFRDLEHKRKVTESKPRMTSGWTPVTPILLGQ
jgi:hypothetical protein